VVKVLHSSTRIMKSGAILKLSSILATRKGLPFRDVRDVCLMLKGCSCAHII